MAAPSRPATQAELFREAALYGGVYLVVNSISFKEFRLLSQDDYDITVTPKGYIVNPKPAPSEEVPHG